jgi:hypothetical protein
MSRRPLNTAVGGSDTDVYSNVSSLSSTLGGSGSVTARTGAIHDAILTTPGSTVSTDLATARNLMVSSTGVTMQADLSSLAQLLNGTSNGSTLEARIGSPTVNGNQASLATVIGTTGSDLATQLGDPGGTFADVSSMIGTSDAASLAEALGNSGDGSSTINALLGGSDTTSPYGKIVGANGILNSIDGTTTDSSNIAAKLSTQTARINSGATQLSSSINDVATAIGHTGTLAERIGAPTLNGNASSLSDVIGGSGTTLATQLGDPVTGTGLSGKIAATGTSNAGGLFSDGPFSAFRESTSLVAQADAFVALMDPAAWVNSNATELTFSLANPPTSLGGLIEKASATG